MPHSPPASTHSLRTLRASLLFSNQLLWVGSVMTTRGWSHRLTQMPHGSPTPPSRRGSLLSWYISVRRDTQCGY